MSITQVAKNSFQEGLIMDFAPSTTLANCMTSALNATLLTFNGNEMSLQNDMGNARVETARLPDGYIPVGTCEFGDIIYIVSYNPLTNKSLIGCFPSPERNIDTKEQGLPGQTIQASDFLVFDNDKPTGDLKTMSKKVILTNLLSPGDKYAIHATNTNNKPIYEEKLSGVGAENVNEFPQLLKVSVVSFEEDGKIKYLDSSVKWYDDIGYFILNNVGDENSIPDIDTYKNILQSGYSIFLSKVAGKLGLYFELEAITSFSCSHDVVLLGEEKKDNGIIYKKYGLNIDLNWTNNNKFVNPSYIIVDDTYLENIRDEEEAKKFFLYTNINDIKTLDEDKLIKGISLINTYILDDTNYGKYKSLKAFYDKDLLSCEEMVSNITYKKIINSETKNIEERYYTILSENDITDKIYDDEIVNYLNKSVYKLFGTILIPYKTENNEEIKSDIKLHYSITPAMSYGKLSQYTLKNVIEFAKIGTGYVGITDWKYYNTDTLSTLTFGLDVYPEPNHHVEKIVLCFYDNEGFAGAYNIENKNSYSGKFTEIIPLDNSIPSYKLVNNYRNDWCIDTINTSINEGEFVKINNVKQFKEAIKIPDLVIYNGSYIKTEIYKQLKEVDEFFEKINVNGEEGIAYYNSLNAEIKANKLYLVKIIIEDVSNLDVTQKEFKTIDRWFWSNSMFNDNYYTVSDFTLLRPTLQFDCGAYYYAEDLYPERIELPKDENRKAEVIKQEILNKPISTSLLVGFYNNFNTFNLHHPKEGDSYILNKEENGLLIPAVGALNNIEITVNVPDKSIITYPNNIEYKSFNGAKNADCNLLPERSDIYNEITESAYDQFKLEIDTNFVTHNLDKDYLASTLEYLEQQPTKYVNLLLKDLYFISEKEYKSIELNVTLQNYNYHAVIYDLVTKQLPAIKPLVYKKEDLEAYNLWYNENTKHFYIKDLYLIAGQHYMTRFACVRPCSINLASGVININYNNRTYIWDFGGLYGYKHLNIIGKNADLLKRTKDGFYLWGIDYYELNNFDGGSWTETAVVADNNFEGNNPESKRIWFTNPNRLVNFPIDGDLRRDWRIYDDDNHTTYKSLFKSTPSTYVGSTTYAEGFATSTMFGLALVYKGTWYTLNNVFNFKVNTIDGELEISKALTLEIQYNGNLYYIPNTVTYYINNMGEDFSFINQIKDRLFNNKNDLVGPGYITVHKKDNQWDIRIPYDIRINYKGNLYGVRHSRSFVTLNRDSWFSADLTETFNWMWFPLLADTSGNYLMSRYKENGKWKQSAKLRFNFLSGNYKIDISVIRNSVPLNIFKSYFNNEGIYFYERNTITLSDNTTITGLIKHTIPYNPIPNKGRCDSVTYKLVKEYVNSCDYYIANSDGTLSDLPAVCKPGYEYVQYHSDFSAKGWNEFATRDDLYRCVGYDFTRLGYYVINNLGAFTDEPASRNITNAIVDYEYNVILPKEGTGLWYYVTFTGELDYSTPIYYYNTQEALYDSEYTVIAADETGNYYKVYTSDDAIPDDKLPGHITNTSAKFYMYNKNTACAVVFPKNLKFVQTINDLANATYTFSENLYLTDMDGNTITEPVYEIDKEAKYEFQFDEENSQYNLYGYVGNQEGEFKAEDLAIIPFSIEQNENITYDVPTLKENLPITPGDALVGLLNSIYIKVDNYTLDNLVPVDTLYTNYTTKYTKDVFYEVSVKNGTKFEDLLRINNIPWNTYMADLANYINYDNKLPNVQITINPCKKTIPIELNIAAPKISESYSNEGNCYIVHDNVVKLATLTLEDDVMYYLDNQNIPRFLTLQTIAVASKPILIRNEETGSEYITSVSAERSIDVPNSFTVDNLHKAFKIKEGYLTLKEDYHVNEDMFQITLDEVGDSCTAIRDIPLKASLFNGTEILTTLDHVDA